MIAFVLLNATNAGGVPVLAGSPGTYPVFFQSISGTGYGGRVQVGAVNVTGTLFSGISIGTGTATFAQWTTLGVVTIGRTAPGTLGILFPNISVYTGQEISRSFVPEPTSGTLVMAGLPSLAGLSAIGRRRS